MEVKQMVIRKTKAVKTVVLMMCSVCLLSCGKSKRQLEKELLERRVFWIFQKAYYRDKSYESAFKRNTGNPPALLPDSELIYHALSDTAEFNLDRINDSLFELTGKIYRGPR